MKRSDADQTEYVWITKYALTRGLFRIKAEIVDGKYARAGWRLFTKEWCRTDEQARAAFDKMRKRKIATLQRQIKQLEECVPNLERGCNCTGIRSVRSRADALDLVNGHEPECESLVPAVQP